MNTRFDTAGSIPERASNKAVLERVVGDAVTYHPRDVRDLLDRLDVWNEKEPSRGKVADSDEAGQDSDLMSAT